MSLYVQDVVSRTSYRFRQLQARPASRIRFHLASGKKTFRQLEATNLKQLEIHFLTNLMSRSSCDCKCYDNYLSSLALKQLMPPACKGSEHPSSKVTGHGYMGCPVWKSGSLVYTNQSSLDQREIANKARNMRHASTLLQVIRTFSRVTR